MKVSLVSLGCVKNQVDSEMISTYFKNNNFELVNDLSISDVIIVNTCGFIDSAKQEAIDTILSMEEYKENGICKHLIVVGCLAKRYKKDIQKEFKLVDLIIGNDEYDNLDSILTKYFKEKITGKLEYTNRLISSKFPSAYIKISDGCNNNCNYCAIPLIRGKFKSRKIEDILQEVEWLAHAGFTEFNIISQDTTKYGLDIYNEYKLKELLNKISKIQGVKWIRILYMYLYELTDDLLLEIKNNDKIVKYFDIPIQHISNNILKSMNRHDTKELIYEKLNKIRKTIPDAIIRTTVIVGFPGETDLDYNLLLQGIKDLKFDRLGAFKYSKEQDTVAYSMKDQINNKVKNYRYDTLLKLQQEIMNNLNKKYLNKELEVLVEDVSSDEKYFIARSYMDAPDVDSNILIELNKDSVNKCIVGEYINVVVNSCDGYDLISTVI